MKPFEIDDNLRQICQKTSKTMKMDLCGLDLIYSNNKWFVLETNSCPGLLFIEQETPKVIKTLGDYIIQEYEKCIK